MHRALTAVGITALVLGALVSLVPLFPVPSGAQTVGNGTIADFEVHSLVFPLYIELPWTSNSTSTEVFAVDCGPQMPVGAALSPCSQGTVLARGTGSSGTLSFSAQNGDWIYVGANNGMAKISLRVSNGEVGFASVVLGSILLVLGLTVRPSKGPRGEAPSLRSSPLKGRADSTSSEPASEDEGTDGQGSSPGRQARPRPASSDRKRSATSDAKDASPASPASTGSESEVPDDEGRATSSAPAGESGSDQEGGEDREDGGNGGPSEVQGDAPEGPADEAAPGEAGRSEVGTS